MTATAHSYRQGRAVRRRGRVVRQTDRDLWLLESLAKLRFGTTTQLARLHFGGSRWAASKRLRRLLDGGLVRAWVRSLSEENVYSLDRAGARVLEKSGAGEGWTVPRGLDRNLDHLLAINQVRLSLALGLAEAGGEISWWRSDWELRTGVRGHVVPDAFFEVRWGTGEASAFSLELDNGSRSPKKFIGKMLAYARFGGGGTVRAFGEFTVLVVCRERRDLGGYREALRRAGLGQQVWFATLGGVESGALDAIWSAPFDDEQRSLRDVAGVLYGKEGSSSGCATSARG